MIANALSFSMLAVGSFFFIPRIIGFACNWAMCVSSCCIWAFFLVAASTNAFASHCMNNLAPSTFDGNTFSDSTTYKSDGKLLGMITIVLIIVNVLQCATGHLPFFMTPPYEKVDKIRKKEMKEAAKERKKLEEQQQQLQVQQMQMMQMQMAQMQGQQPMQGQPVSGQPLDANG